jgi:hypothetical protein
MKKTWEVTQVEIIPTPISADLYNQLLEELAELVYRHLCQFPEKDNLVPETSSASSLRKTGTSE